MTEILGCGAHPPYVLQKVVILKGVKVPVFSQPSTSVHSKKVSLDFCLVSSYRSRAPAPNVTPVVKAAELFGSSLGHTTIQAKINKSTVTLSRHIVQKKRYPRR